MSDQRMEIPDLRTGPGPDLNSKLSIGDMMMLMADAGKAFPIFYFPSSDSPPTRFVSGADVIRTGAAGAQRTSSAR